MRPGPYCLALVELHPPFSDSPENRGGRHGHSSSSPASFEADLEGSSSSYSSSSSRHHGKHYNYHAAGWRSAQRSEDAWVVTRLVLHTCGAARPSFCAPLVDSLARTLVTHRALASSNQIRDGVDIASSFGNTAAADAMAVASAAATMDAAIRSGLPRALEVAARQATTLPVRGIVHGSTLVDVPLEHIPPYYQPSDDDGDDGGMGREESHRATYSIFLGGALAIVCLDTQQGSNPFLAARLVRYAVSAVRTCLACVPGVSDRKTSLRQRVDRKRNELSLLLQRILVTRESSTHLAPKPRAAQMSLTGNTPLLHRSHGAHIPSSSLLLPLSNDVVADFASDIWQEHLEDTGPTRWFGLRFDVVGDEYMDAASKMASSEELLARRAEVDLARSRSKLSNSSISGDDAKKDKSTTFEAVIDGTRAQKARVSDVNTRGARAESTMWGQKDSGIINLLGGGERKHHSIREEQIQGSAALSSGRKSPASPKDLDDWFSNSGGSGRNSSDGNNNRNLGFNSSTRSVPAFSSSVDGDNSSGETNANGNGNAFSLDMSGEFGSFGDFDDEQFGAIKVGSHDSGADKRSPQVWGFGGGTDGKQGIKNGGGVTIRATPSPPGRSLSPVLEDEDGNEDGTTHPAASIQEPPKIMLSNVISPRGTRILPQRGKITRNSVIENISTVRIQGKDPAARQISKKGGSPRRNSAMPAPSSSSASTFFSASSSSSSTSTSSMRSATGVRHGTGPKNDKANDKSGSRGQTSDILLDTDVMTLLSEELLATIVDSKVKKVSVRGSLEIRAKLRHSSSPAAMNNLNVRGAFLLHLKSKFPLSSLKHDNHYVRKKKTGAGGVTNADHSLPKSSSASNTREISVKHSYQCLMPAHPSRKQATKVLRFMVQPQRSFISPLVQHIKASPSIMADSNKGIHRVALRLKLTSNPALPSNAILSRVVISAKFNDMPR